MNIKTTILGTCELGIIAQYGKSIVHSYVIDVADPNLILVYTALVSEIFAFYHLLVEQNVVVLVHLVPNNACSNSAHL